MNALFRHLSMRLWLTALVGGSFCLTLVPWWQEVFGPHWLWVPVLAILATCFGVAGWVMNRVGIALALRQVNEATVWERAGMIREAENAFQRSASFFDSFWLSPMARRSKTRWLSSALARFYLSQFEGRAYTRSLAAAYLIDYPQDEALAESWLEGLLSREHCSDQEHAAVARVGQALGHLKTIQRLLMQFYLANRRVDFDAQQTYRRVWKEKEKNPLTRRQLHALARLLRNEAIINLWALQVYLEAYQDGQTEAIEGIAAGLRLFPSGEQSRRDLATARRLTAGFSPEERHRLTSRFKPADIEPARKPVGKPYGGREAWVSGAVKAVRIGLASGQKGSQRILAAGRQLGTVLDWHHALFALGLCAAGGLILFALLAGEKPPRIIEPGPEPAVSTTTQDKPAVTDPFTIQVAAYLNFEDARRFVDQLTRKNLDAYLTKATSTNRTWYQVKVSHFATREAAQSFGNDLKSKGLIDDFYVANYVKPM